jgi:hypothetical protein
MAASMHGRGQEVLGNFQTLLQNAGWVGPVLAETAPGLKAFGPAVGAMFAGLILTTGWNNPANALLFEKFLGRVQNFLDTRASDLKVVGDALLPQFQGIGGALMNFDTAQILSNALSGIPEEGAITLHVTIPDN